jgi:hypothetical protein
VHEGEREEHGCGKAGLSSERADDMSHVLPDALQLNMTNKQTAVKPRAAAN